MRRELSTAGILDKDFLLHLFIQEDVSLPVRSGTVAALIGLHARPAALFVRAVTETGLPVVIRKTGSTSGVDARSLLEVMTADFGHGCEVDLIVADEALEDAYAASKAAAALDRLVQLLESQNGS